LRAVLCKSFSPPETLVIEDVPSPVPGPGQVVISVKAASVNFPDTLIIQNKYQYKPPLPFSPGSECAGIVKAVGDGVTRFKPGDRVMAVTTYGSFAEEVVTDQSRVLSIPAGMDFPTAAAFTLTYGTSAHALVDRGELKGGEMLLVLGASGGVGLAAIEIGKALGATVIASASPGKHETVSASGADHVVDARRADIAAEVLRLTDGAGVDVVLESAGGATFAASLAAAKRVTGRVVVVGLAGGEAPITNWDLVYRHQVHVIGFNLGVLIAAAPQIFGAVMVELSALLAAGVVAPGRPTVYDLADGPKALAELESRSTVGKLALVP